MQHAVRPAERTELYAPCAVEDPAEHELCPASQPQTIPPGGRCDCTCHDPRRPGPA